MKIGDHGMICDKVWGRMRYRDCEIVGEVQSQDCWLVHIEFSVTSVCVPKADVIIESWERGEPSFVGDLLVRGVPDRVKRQ